MLDPSKFHSGTSGEVEKRQKVKGGRVTAQMISGTKEKQSVTHVFRQKKEKGRNVTESPGWIYCQGNVNLLPFGVSATCGCDVCNRMRPMLKDESMLDKLTGLAIALRAL